jgi:hypothetical protein
LDKFSYVLGGGGAGGGLSSTETNETAATSAARQQQHRLQRQREAKTKTKAASGGCLSDHFSHLRPFQSVGSVFGVSSDNNNINVTGRPRRNSTNATQADNEHPAVAVLARCYQVRPDGAFPNPTATVYCFSFSALLVMYVALPVLVTFTGVLAAVTNTSQSRLFGPSTPDYLLIHVTEYTHTQDS